MRSRGKREFWSSGGEEVFVGGLKRREIRDGVRVVYQEKRIDVGGGVRRGTDTPPRWG